MFIDEEVRTHEANGNTIFTSRPVGRRGSLPRRYFLRGLPELRSVGRGSF
jgi:hypothetical protein